MFLLRPPSSANGRHGGRSAPRVSAGATTRERLAPAAAASGALPAHFLFNALHAIAALVRERRNADAVRALDQLGDLQRMILLHSHRLLWPLADELAFVRRYTAFEQLRFGERCVVAFDIADGLDALSVPTLALQTLVENAIKHGVARRIGPSCVTVRAAVEGDALVFTVCNDRPDFPACVPGLGFGLRAIRAQLALLDDEKAGFRLDLKASAGVVATLRLPLTAVESCRR
jgi:two-component system, LytTR family, sensor kinase